MTQLQIDRQRPANSLPPFLAPESALPQAARQPVSPHSPTQNHLLAALPADEFARLSPHLELVTLSAGETLCEPGRTLQYAYFPTSAILSLHHVMRSGASAESASIANDGVLGVALFMGSETSPSSAVVQTAGHGYRLPARLLKSEFNRAGALQRLMLRYTLTLIAQTAQTAACNRHHQTEQQLCRWLLFTLERSKSPELVMTQESVAATLGVRREGITEAAGRLQRAGIIRTRRGHVTVIDRDALEARACECHSVIRTEFQRLLSDVRREKGASSSVFPVDAQRPTQWRAGNRVH